MILKIIPHKNVDFLVQARAEIARLKKKELVISYLENVIDFYLDQIDSDTISESKALEKFHKFITPEALDSINAFVNSQIEV